MTRGAHADVELLSGEDMIAARLVDPLRQRLVVNPAHPDRPVFRMVGMRPVPLDLEALRDDP